MHVSTARLMPPLLTSSQVIIVSGPTGTASGQVSEAALASESTQHLLDQPELQCPSYQQGNSLAKLACVLLNSLSLITYTLRILSPVTAVVISPQLEGKAFHCDQLAMNCSCSVLCHMCMLRHATLSLLNGLNVAKPAHVCAVSKMQLAFHA